MHLLGGPLVHTRLEGASLAVFLGSTVVAIVAVYVAGDGNQDDADDRWWAIANSYAFSTSYVVLFWAPFLRWPRTAPAPTIWDRLDRAMFNWVVWLTCFTEVVFQVFHNVGVPLLHAYRRSALEWPFYSYGLSDGRWSEYNGGRNLAPQVWLINWNDGWLGIFVALSVWGGRNAASAAATAVGKASSANGAATAVHHATLAIVLVTLFRDATLFRETVEYMYDHHRDGYPHTTEDAGLRPHAIACLWIVNIMWLVAPLLTLMWAYTQLLFWARRSEEGAVDGKLKTR